MHYVLKKKKLVLNIWYNFIDLFLTYREEQVLLWVKLTVAMVSLLILIVALRKCKNDSNNGAQSDVITSSNSQITIQLAQLWTTIRICALKSYYMMLCMILYITYITNNGLHKYIQKKQKYIPLKLNTWTEVGYKTEASMSYSVQGWASWIVIWLLACCC